MAYQGGIQWLRATDLTSPHILTQRDRDIHVKIRPNSGNLADFSFVVPCTQSTLVVSQLTIRGNAIKITIDGVVEEQPEKFTLCHHRPITVNLRLCRKTKVKLNLSYQQMTLADIAAQIDLSQPLPSHFPSHQVERALKLVQLEHGPIVDLSGTKLNQPVNLAQVQTLQTELVKARATLRQQQKLLDIGVDKEQQLAFFNSLKQHLQEQIAAVDREMTKVEQGLSVDSSLNLSKQQIRLAERDLLKSLGLPCPIIDSNG